MKRFTASLALAGILLWAAPLQADSFQTYTNTRFLYSVDYPEKWKVKEVNHVALFLSPYESAEDKFSENLNIVVEDVSSAGSLSLIDYHRKSSEGASRLLPGFKLLEEAQTQWEGRQAIVELYTALIKNEPFKFKAVKFMVGSQVYVFTYTAKLSDFDQYLPQAERIIRSIRVSP